jgi:hypothetical protein
VTEQGKRVLAVLARHGRRVRTNSTLLGGSSWRRVVGARTAECQGLVDVAARVENEVHEILDRLRRLGIVAMR